MEPLFQHLVPQGSILRPLLSLMFINDLPNGLNSNAKLFADDTSLLSVVHSINDSVNLLNSDFSKIDEWAVQWKMSFNPDSTKTNSRDHIQSVAKRHIEITRTLCLIIA